MNKNRITQLNGGNFINFSIFFWKKVINDLVFHLFDKTIKCHKMILYFLKTWKNKSCLIWYLILKSLVTWLFLKYNHIISVNLGEFMWNDKIILNTWRIDLGLYYIVARCGYSCLETTISLIFSFKQIKIFFLIQWWRGVTALHTLLYYIDIILSSQIIIKGMYFIKFW